MRTDVSRSGQAGVEFAIGVMTFALIIVMICEFAPLLFKTLDFQSDARTAAGESAMSSHFSNGGRSAAAIASLATPSGASDGKYSDPWEYPLEHVGNGEWMPSWRSSSIGTGSSVEGTAGKTFDFSLWIGGKSAVSGKGSILETVTMPSLGLKR